MLKCTYVVRHQLTIIRPSRRRHCPIAKVLDSRWWLVVPLFRFENPPPRFLRAPRSFVAPPSLVSALALQNKNTNQAAMPAMNGSSSFVPLSSSSTTPNPSSASAAAVGSSRRGNGNPDLVLPFSGHNPHFLGGGAAAASTRSGGGVNQQQPNSNSTGWGAAFIAAALAGTTANSNSNNIMSAVSHPSNSAADAIAALSVFTAATSASGAAAAAAAAAATAATTNALAISSSSNRIGHSSGGSISIIVDTCRRCGATGCDVRIEHSNDGKGGNTVNEATTTTTEGCLLHAVRRIERAAERTCW
jgi:hypothetical protein